MPPVLFGVIFALAWIAAAVVVLSFLKGASNLRRIEVTELNEAARQRADIGFPKTGQAV